jgi:hypothetical protein
MGDQRDSEEVDPLTGAEEAKKTQPLETVPKGRKPNASNAEIPGTGRVMKGIDGNEAKRVTTT